MRVVLTDLSGRRRPTNSPRKSRLAAISLGDKQPKTHPRLGMKKPVRSVKQSILKYHSGVGDIIHSVIMKNNGVTEILTFDEKDDFAKIVGLTALHPRDVQL